MDLTTSLPKLESILLDEQIKVEAWLRDQFKLTPPPIYASMDLRNSGFKIAPVDTNLFPAGFNNLNPQFMPLYIQAAQAVLTEICPDASQILLVPESHTRNLFYLENIAILQDILQSAGFEVRIGSLISDLHENQEITLPSGKKILLEPLLRNNNKIGLKGFSPCLVLLNNDLSGGVPALLENLQQKVLPPLGMGWFNRLKSTHFHHYAAATAEFAQKIGFDPWLITPLFTQHQEVNFMTGEGIDGLIEKTEILLSNIQNKYDEHTIKLKPFVVIKADAGTYGMAVMMVKNPADLKNLNRQQRKQMAVVKNGKTVNQILLQEGIYTFESVNNNVAEPVIYTMGRCVIGGFYRVHSERGEDENLNAPGAHFAPLPFETACNHPRRNETKNCAANRFYIYGVIARLALVAAARELKEIQQ